jgi:hypothetical protein
VTNAPTKPHEKNSYKRTETERIKMKITNENALRIAAAMAQLDLRIGSHFCALTNPTDKDFADMRQLAINFDLPELAAQFQPQLAEVKPLEVGMADPETQFVVEIGGSK